ncbi:hypothetical protein [Streptomyces calidiresistens]
MSEQSSMGFSLRAEGNSVGVGFADTVNIHSSPPREPASWLPGGRDPGPLPPDGRKRRDFTDPIP